MEDGDTYGNPESFFVFIIGVCGEWQQGRQRNGDIGLHKEYLNAGVPQDQVIAIRDHDATRSHCEEEFLALLKRTRPFTTLLFYYGGHGGPTAFDTREGEWRHQDVVYLIDSFFQGERVVLLLDCCSSGSFYRWVEPSNVTCHQYVCIMSTPAYVEAGAAWTLTKCWIRSLRCNDGKLPLARVIEYLADSVARIKEDQLTVYLSDEVDAERGNWLPIRRKEEVTEELSWPRLESCVPLRAAVTSNWSVGDVLYYKHPGGPSTNNSRYIPPVWLRALIVSRRMGGRLELKVECPMSKIEWSVHQRRKHLLNDLHMAQVWMVPHKFEQVQCCLAKNSKFIDFSMPPATRVLAKTEDGGENEAVVEDWRAMDWVSFLASGGCSDEPPYGAHVLVRWLRTGRTSLVTAMDMVSPPMETTEFVPTAKLGEEACQSRAMVRSFESSGKVLSDAGRVVGSKLSAFWPKDGEWYDATPLNLHTMSDRVIATHSRFTLKGTYCPVLYEDNTSALVPLHYLRPQKSSCWLW